MGSVRCCPKVYRRSGSRPAAADEYSAMRYASTSLIMCAASPSSASEPSAVPAMSSRVANAATSAAAAAMRRRVDRTRASRSSVSAASWALRPPRMTMRDVVSASRVPNPDTGSNPRHRRHVSHCADTVSGSLTSGSPTASRWKVVANIVEGHGCREGA